MLPVMVNLVPACKDGPHVLVSPTLKITGF